MARAMGMSSSDESLPWSDRAVPAVRRAILSLVARCEFDAHEFVASLEGDDRNLWKAATSETARDPLRDPITDPEHLDELWGLFFASGSFAPIHRLCEALSPEETDAVPDQEYQPNKDKEAVYLRVVIRGAAAWSIGSNASQHPLVKSYCEWMLEAEKVPNGVRAQIQKALEE